MKFSIDLDELQYVLKCLRVSVKSNSTEEEGRVSILAHEGNSVDFSTDIGIIGASVKASSASVVEAGTISVLYGELQNFISSFKPWVEERGGVKDVTFKLNPKSLSVSLVNVYGKDKSSKSNIKLKRYSGADKKSKDFSEVSFVLNSSMLKASIDKTVGAVDPLNHNNYLRGLNINFNKDVIYFAGTNGIMVSEYAVKNTSSLADKSYLLTYDFVRGFRGILANISKEEAQVEFNATDKVIKARVNNILFWGQLLFGHTYPEYRVVFTKQYTHKLVLDRDLLLNNLNPLIGSLDDDDNNRMSIAIDKDGVRLFNDFSESFFEIEPPFEGTFVIDVNGKLCRDLVNTIKDDKLIMCFSNETENVVFDSEMFEDQKSLLTFIRRRNV